MDLFHGRQIHPLILHLQINGLPSNHSIHTSSTSQFVNQIQHDFGLEGTHRFESGNQIEGLCQKGVPSQEGDPLAKDLWLVGFPLLRSSLSRAGRSSWISE